MANKKLKTFEVDLTYRAIVTETVTAYTEQEAIEKALQSNGRYLDDVEYSYSTVNEVKKSKPKAQ